MWTSASELSRELIGIFNRNPNILVPKSAQLDEDEWDRTFDEAFLKVFENEPFAQRFDSVFEKIDTYKQQKS